MGIYASQLLAHRGCWTNLDFEQVFEKNSFAAIKKAADLGFGLETDIRDFQQVLVISHDVANHSSSVTDLSFVGLFKGPVALNIKSDGLLKLLEHSNLEAQSASKYFFFDMSLPELVQYQRFGYPVAARVSEFEFVTKFETDWIWLDSFNTDWYLDELPSLISEHSPKKIVIVSPELHGRDFLTAWDRIAPIVAADPNIFLCTDYPEAFLARYSAL